MGGKKKINKRPPNQTNPQNLNEPKTWAHQKDEKTDSLKFEKYI